jgi:hypothetical protein
MSTEAKILADRLNAQKSTGPRTEAEQQKCGRLRKIFKGIDRKFSIIVASHPYTESINQLQEPL